MKNLIFAVLALAGLAGLFLALKPQPQPPASATAVAVAPGKKIFELSVRGKKLTAGEPVLKVTQGDTVVLRITSDKADELHLHGYDLSLDLKPNIAGVLTFTANLSGRFDFELHHAHLDLGALEVAPK